MKTENENGEVTIQIHNNLKKSFNNIDDEINRFANKHVKKQEIIPGGKTDIIRNLITLLAEENKQLKEDLNDPHRKMEELGCLIFDSTTQYKNAIKETKK